MVAPPLHVMLRLPPWLARLFVVATSKRYYASAVSLDFGLSWHWQQAGLHAQHLCDVAAAELESCVKDPHLFIPSMRVAGDAAPIRLPVLPPPSVLDREAVAAAVAAAAATLMQGVRDCDVEGARRMGQEDGKWPWRYGGNWIQDCRSTFVNVACVYFHVDCNPIAQARCWRLLGRMWSGQASLVSADMLMS